MIRLRTNNMHLKFDKFSGEFVKEVRSLDLKLGVEPKMLWEGSNFKVFGVRNFWVRFKPIV